ncbi:MAG: N-glycosylase/DNA lyase [bacterium]
MFTKERSRPKNVPPALTRRNTTNCSAKIIKISVPELSQIRNLYKKVKPGILKRLGEFRGKEKTENSRILFTELCYCLLTPQSKARTCWEKVSELNSKGLLFKGGKKEIAECLRGVRFRNNKAGYIYGARKILPELKKGLRKIRDVNKLRRWLVKNVKGYGFKEASHFLRNIGRGTDLAILDRHILKNLLALKAVRKIPGHLSAKDYLSIERKFLNLSRKIKIPAEHLDLLLWCRETHDIFK